MTTSDAGRSFDAAADSYERARPGYPSAAVRWMLSTRPGRVLDLAAGTGKLTRQLVDAGYETVAVEPLPGMREKLASALPGVEALEGTAERIPLDAGAVDAVVVGQAWHWFDQLAAAREIARVLRPGGVLGIAWNFADERPDWVSQLWAMIHAAGRPARVEGRRGETEPPELGDYFVSAERADFGFEQDVDLDTVLALVQSRSYIIQLPVGRREALLAEVRQLFATHPDLAGGTTYSLPYRTICWRATVA
ncbi:MAG TPA: class I SAM-dependent methyltransferase [Mycobacteriales bacterium]|nr:class I SAM-dependent methyltransferase [Mycobacteriales bacterium]